MSKKWTIGKKNPSVSAKGSILDSNKPRQSNDPAKNPPAATDQVDAFLNAVKQTPLSTSGQARGRLIFSLDATASRQATWDAAMRLQRDMFTHTKGIGELDVQLLYYRGYDECRASKWLNNADQVMRMMGKVSCLAGTTQIHRVLKHAIAETRQQPVQALVFVGDCVEEDVDQLGNLAGQCRLLNLPVFIFQEGYNTPASNAFSQIAKLSGGAHCSFDGSSSRVLGELLNAVAAYAAGGKNALLQLQNGGSAQASKLLEQL